MACRADLENNFGEELKNAVTEMHSDIKSATPIYRVASCLHPDASDQAKSKDMRLPLRLSVPHNHNVELDEVKDRADRIFTSVSQGIFIKRASSYIPTEKRLVRKPRRQKCQPP